MNQYVYHCFYDSDKEMILNLFNLNDISYFYHDNNSKGYTISWQCKDDYEIIYYLYFAVDRQDMLNHLVQVMKDCYEDTQCFDVDGTFAFCTYKKSDLSDDSFTFDEQEEVKKITHFYENNFTLIMNRYITSFFPKNKSFNSVPHWETVTSKDGRCTFKIRRIVNE